MQGAIDPPDFLEGEARECWVRLAVDLHAIGILHRLDLGALAGYCSAFATYTAAEVKYRELGEVIQTKTGNVVVNPYLSIRNSALSLMSKLGGELGLSPVARKRLINQSMEDALEQMTNEAAEILAQLQQERCPQLTFEAKDGSGRTGDEAQEP